MTKLITKSYIDAIADSSKNAPYALQVEDMLNRVQVAFKTLNSQGNHAPSISQLANEMSVSRQQLAFWFSKREPYLRHISTREKQRFISWLNRNLETLACDTDSDVVIRLISKRLLMRAFKKQFGKQYGEDIVKAQVAFWNILESYGATSRNIAINGEFKTVTTIRRYNYSRMRHDYIPN